MAMHAAQAISFCLRCVVVESPRARGSMYSWARRLIRRTAPLIVGITTVALVSCAGKGNPKTYPVKGKVLVNGQPAQECQVALNWSKDEKRPATPQGLTNENGEFQLTSFVSNDGAPEGEYVVTIEWHERSGVTKMDFDGPDRLGGEYARIDKNKGLPGFVVKVDRQPLELPPFDLKQSAAAKR